MTETNLSYYFVADRVKLSSSMNDEWRTVNRRRVHPVVFAIIIAVNYACFSSISHYVTKRPPTNIHYQALQRLPILQQLPYSEAVQNVAVISYTSGLIFMHFKHSFHVHFRFKNKEKSLYNTYFIHTFYAMRQRLVFYTFFL